MGRCMRRTPAAARLVPLGGRLRTLRATLIRAAPAADVGKTARLHTTDPRRERTSSGRHDRLDRRAPRR